MKIELHKFQKRAICSDKRIVCCIAGLQSGKTFCGSIWSRMRFSMPDPDPRDTFIITAPTYRIMESSTLPAFLSINSELGRLNKSSMVFNLWDGRKVFLRAMDNSWSCEGITRCKGIWLDEAGLYDDQSWINLMGRAAPQEAPMFISTTPYFAYGWLFQLYEAWREGGRDDVDLYQWTSKDNPFFPEAEYYRQQGLLDPRMFAMRYKGMFSRMAGLVYQDFDRNNIVPPQPIQESKYHIVGGADWGTSHPCAIVVRAIAKSGKTDIQVAEFKKTGLTADQQVQMVSHYHNRYRVSAWVGDSADPGMIALCQSKGIPMVGVDKLNGSVKFGIGVHAELIRTNYHKIFNTCSETEKEYATYAFPKVSENRPVSDNPVKINDHCFAKDTMVTTLSGQRPIQDIKVGEYVLTRYGYREVLLTHEHEAEAFDYGVLKCTPDHKIMTQDGWKPIAELMPGDIYYSLRRNIWSRLLNLMVGSITGTRTQKRDPIGCITERIIVKVLRSIFIGISGNTIMVRFLRVMWSIIKMMTQIIMTLLTLSLELILNICHTMVKRAPILNLISVKSISKESGLRQKSGMDQKPGMNGIRDIIRTIKKSFMNKFPLHVNSVGTPSKEDLPRNSVRIDVNQPGEEILVSMMLKENVVTASSHSPSISTPRSLGVIPVYNLTVDKYHEYFANYSLVANCMDATRYITMHFKHLREKVMNPSFEKPKTHLERLLAGEFSQQPVNHDGLD